jgi:hypothetical protein
MPSDAVCGAADEVDRGGDALHLLQGVRARVSIGLLGAELLRRGELRVVDVAGDDGSPRAPSAPRWRSGQGPPQPSTATESPLSSLGSLLAAL